MIMPRGGKLLTGEQSVRLATADNVDRQALIEHIAAGLHAKERLKDRRSHVLKKLVRKPR